MISCNIKNTLLDFKFAKDANLDEDDNDVGNNISASFSSFREVHSHKYKTFSKMEQASLIASTSTLIYVSKVLTCILYGFKNNQRVLKVICRKRFGALQ